MQRPSQAAARRAAARAAGLEATALAGEAMGRAAALLLARVRAPREGEGWERGREAAAQVAG